MLEVLMLSLREFGMSQRKQVRGQISLRKPDTFRITSRKCLSQAVKFRKTRSNRITTKLKSLETQNINRKTHLVVSHLFEWGGLGKQVPICRG